jgi:hypothetical protein
VLFTLPTQEIGQLIPVTLRTTLLVVAAVTAGVCSAAAGFASGLLAVVFGAGASLHPARIAADATIGHSNLHMITILPVFELIDWRRCERCPLTRS